MAKDTKGFDERLGELEGIVEELEQGGLGLEPAIERYQRGIELLKECHRTLAGYRERVEELSRDAEQSIRPFAGDPDAPGSSAASGAEARPEAGRGTAGADGGRG